MQRAIGKVADTMEPSKARSEIRKAFIDPARVMATKIKASTPVDTGALAKSVGVRSVSKGVDHIAVYVGYINVQRRGLRYSQLLSIEYGSAKTSEHRAIRQAFDSLDPEKIRLQILNALESAIRTAVRRYGRGKLRYSRGG